MMLRSELLLTLTRPPGWARTDALSLAETFSLIEATSNAGGFAGACACSDDDTRCRAQAKAKEPAERRVAVHATNNAPRSERLTGEKEESE